MLLSILEDCGRISPDINPGMYAFLQCRMKAPPGKSLPATKFRIIKCKGMADTRKNNEAMDLINELVVKYGKKE